MIVFHIRVREHSVNLANVPHRNAMQVPLFDIPREKKDGDNSFESGTNILELVGLWTQAKCLITMCFSKFFFPS